MGTKKLIETKPSYDLIIHGGIFHADDVFSVAFLSTKFDMLIDRRNNISDDEIRNVHGFDRLIVDVGGIYNPEMGLFDHHQSDAPTAADGHKLCSFEQLLCHFGTDTDKAALGAIAKDISLNDNGEAKHRSGLCIAIHNFVPEFGSTDDIEEKFMMAVEFASSIIESAIKQQKATELATETMIIDAMKKAQNGIMVLDQYAPFESKIISSNIKVTVYPSIRGGFMVRISNVAPGSFDLVGKFGEEWKPGYKSCTFVHASGFCGSCDTLEDAIEMAKSVK